LPVPAGSRRYLLAERAGSRRSLPSRPIVVERRPLGRRRRTAG
jgi:hypothetical protein